MYHVTNRNVLQIVSCYKLFDILYYLQYNVCSMSICDKCGCDSDNVMSDDDVNKWYELSQQQMAYHYAVEAIMDSKQKEKLWITYEDNLKKIKEHTFNEDIGDPRQYH